MSPSQARNAIRKALVEILDPNPDEQDMNAMWAHFGSRCAFCGSTLERSKREAYADYFVAAVPVGRNAFFNRVLACATCNGDEKLNTSDWKRFLETNFPKDGPARHHAILQWHETHQMRCQIDLAKLATIIALLEKAIHAFDQAVQQAGMLGNPKETEIDPPGIGH